MLPPLYAIVDADGAAALDTTPVDLARAFLRGGARLLQLRAKAASSGAFLEWADAVAVAAREYDALLVINDRADIAAMVGAGVHVGQDDLPPANVRAVVGPSALVGYSTHTLEQLDAALAEPLSYVAVGPVFGTRTKDTGYAPVGLDLVRLAADRAAGRMPVVAIGGITMATAASVLDAGATSLAVIGDLIAGDPEGRVRAWTALLACRS